MSGKRDLNPRPSPWQGDALPLSYSRFFAQSQLTGHQNIETVGEFLTRVMGEVNIMSTPCGLTLGP